MGELTRLYADSALHLEEKKKKVMKKPETSSAKYFSSFRVDNYKIHLSKQHPCRWLEYQKISYDSEEVSTFLM